MKFSDSPLTYNPFGNLKVLLDKKSHHPASPSVHTSLYESKLPVDHREDRELFREAMQDVTPIEKDLAEEKVTGTRQPEGLTHDAEAEALLQLVNLVHHGDGLILSNTQEYMEGTGDNVPREFAKKLHRGDFSIQAHIDLHGFSVEEAQDAVNRFLRESVISGKRAVLIIHGRGLSSPGEPVLKNKVREWITSGHWRKWVMAFTSAPSYDGGTGATYILLRNRPVSKRRGKRPTKT
ncbi:MAG: DNA mismatch repair protein MutS [Deltaproteobacteria bacterium]|nr:DNA mismatch repair protein MutS [Deltaproteobacteria bacterium]